MALSQGVIRYIIFVASLALLPVLFYLIMGVIISPVLPVFIVSVVNAGSGGFPVLLLCLGWTAFLYFCSGYIARKLSKRSLNIKVLYLAGVLILLILTSIAPINTIRGNNKANVFQVYEYRYLDLQENY